MGEAYDNFGASDIFPAPYSVRSKREHQRRTTTIGAPFDMCIRIDRVVVLRGYSPEADCLPHQSSDAFGLHLLHDLSAIAINRSHAEVKRDRDGVACEPVRHQIENLDLARRQPCKSSVEGALRSLQIQVFEAPG